MASLSALSPKAQRFLNASAQAKQFKALIAQREQEAADLATQMSKFAFIGGRIPRPPAPPRPGRPTTEGHFTSFIHWMPSSKNKGFVEFDIPALETKAPYWLIQEIGTNHSATILNSGVQVSVKSQLGRTISANLFWASGPGGQAVKAVTGGFGEQLYLAADLDANSIAGVKRRKKRIRREIPGRHYLKAGGVEGFRYLGETLSADAKKIFR